MNAEFLAHWLTTAAALGVTTWILPGVRVDSALVLGFVNARSGVFDAHRHRDGRWRT